MTAISRFTHRFTSFFITVAIGLALLPPTGQAQAFTTYPIVDTGQTACYDDRGAEITCPAEGAALYGQDAQHDGNQPSYTDNGDGTITDHVTGLMWQQSADTDGDGDIDAADKLTYTEAGTYCQNLTLAGHTDWRLPDIKQLYSLIDFSGIDPSGYEGSGTSGMVPFIDTAYFDFAYGDTAAGERIIDAQYASSTLYVANTGGDGGRTMFGVNFADGRIKGYGLTLFGQEKTFFVICARENTSYGQNDLVDNGDGTITDNATGLMWSQDDSGTGLNWEEALAWVEGQNAANYLGYNDWRLPNAKELQSIVDYTRSPDTTGSAAVDPLFNTTAITNEAGQADFPFYWSSTTHANWTATPGAFGVYVAFGRAMGYMNSTWVDVHGAGAQRSDPKSGDPADWPYGNGPQGDAVRIYNFVRPVRDADADSGTASFPAPVLDTGQAACYNSDGEEITCPAPGEAFYGQDAQYTGPAFDFVDNGDSAVTDNITGLMWQQTPINSQYNWADALAYCESLSLAGYDDWRAPSLKELFSISDFETGWPYLDTDYFSLVNAPELRMQQYWSSNFYEVGTTHDGMPSSFGVNHGTGHIKAYPDGSDGAPMAAKYVRCVRGDDYGLNDFVDNGDGTITDNATGLMWLQDDNGVGVDWEDALAYADGFSFAGYDDWRLPNVKELQSIVDYSGVYPAIDQTYFNITDEDAYFWSSTSAYFSPDSPGYYYGWYVAFGYAVGADGEDLHGAGAVRFDTKVEGGPAGEDPERIYNYVRLVRDADPEVTPPGDYEIYVPLILASGSNTDTPTFTIDQTLSDGAQRNTIAFDALAFLTGDLGADSFFPPGKVADFWGFQYLRDNDPTEMGHNTDFLTRAALNMLHVLTPAQRAELVALAESQVDDINQYAYNRFVLMGAFRRLLEGDLPSGATRLDEEAVKAYSAELYRLDGEISYDRAQVMGALISTFTADQQAYLDAMVGQGMLTWPDVEEPEELRGLDYDVKVAVMTYAGDMFSWYAGSVEADVYFCPERQGTYFGTFYIKDAPAVGNPDYTIPSNLTADMGDAFLQTLTPEQSPTITDLVESQKPALYEIVDRRKDVATLLRQFMRGETPDRATVLSLMERYGELDGEIVYRYATAFAQVDQALTAEQQTQLMTLRTNLLGDLSFPDGAYLYAESIAIPDIPNTDFLFAVPAG